jgi:hypothetical protein
MSLTKWDKGPVKLANGQDAFIDAINEGQEVYRYTGRIRNHANDWIAAGWHDNGRFMFAGKDHECNLFTPPKKTMRLQVWLMVWLDGSVTVYFHPDEANASAKKHGFALIPIDREVTEGDGLS